MKQKIRRRLEPILQYINDTFDFEEELELYYDEEEQEWVLYTGLYTDSAFPFTEKTSFVGIIKDILDFVTEQSCALQRKWDKRPITELERAARDKAIKNGEEVGTFCNSADDGQAGYNCFYSAGRLRPTLSEINNWVYCNTGLYRDELGPFVKIPREVYENVSHAVRKYVTSYKAGHTPILQCLIVTEEEKETEE